MLTFVLSRVLQTAITALGVVTLVFFLLRVVPGDPAQMFLDEYATEASLQAVRDRLGLEQPLMVQFGTYVGSVLKGDLGRSFQTGRPVSSDLMAAIPHTVRLAVAGIMVSIVVGVPMGILAVRYRNTPIDSGSRVASLLFVSTPDFVVGICLLLVFTLWLRWLPATGLGDGSLLGTLKHLALPSLAVGANYAAITARMTRSSVLEIYFQDYVRTARAKGQTEHLVFYRHALRNALLPVITIIGLNMGRLLGGTIIVERVFSRDGIGTVLVTSLAARDYTVVQGGILVFALGIALVNMLVDITYGFIDPRIRYT